MKKSEVVILSPSYSVREEYWYFYQIGPIDWLWRGLMAPEIAETMVARDDEFDDYEPEDEQAEEGPVEPILSEQEAEIEAEPYEPLAAKKFRKDLEAARGFAKHAGWEGDCVSGPGVFWLPDPASLTFRYAFAWKQMNNGTTFVVSPLPLAWLGGAKTCQ